MTRNHNGGLRKVCGCPRRTWAKCPHSWYLNFKPAGGPSYRLSLDKHHGKHIDNKTDAEAEAEKIRIAIREGHFGKPAPRQDMTLRGLADLYEERYVAVERAATASNFKSELNVICSTAIVTPAGPALKLGEWRVADVVTDTIERYREARKAAGNGNGANRSLSRLRAVFNWALRVGYLEASPFTRHGVSVVRLSRETPRSRRLHDDEESALLAKSQPHLAALIVGALETGMRLGELLDLRWRQVEGCLLKTRNEVLWDRRAAIVLVAEQTKTRRARRIPISTRLRGVLELRRFDPDGKPLPPESHVFGNQIGQRVGDVSRARYASVLRAHGHTPIYDDNKNLEAPSRQALETIDLHFHDLRREAGSRWLDGGVPLHTIRDWLGHTNISQTSTYPGRHDDDAGGRDGRVPGAARCFATVCNGPKQGGESGSSRPPRLTRNPIKSRSTVNRP